METFISRFHLQPDLGSQQVLMGWGRSSTISYWVPDADPIQVPPKRLTYLDADTGAVTHCSGGTPDGVLSLSFCTTTTGKVIIWGDQIGAIDFNYRYGLPQPAINLTIPSKADTRSVLLNLDITGMWDENPYSTGWLVIQLGCCNIQYLASGQADTLSTRAAPISENGYMTVSVGPMAAHTAMIGNSGHAYSTFYSTSLTPPQMESWAEIPGFASVSLVQIQVFSLPNPTTGEWIQWDQLDQNRALAPVGYLALSNDGKLYWTKRAPVPEWETTSPDVNGLNEIPLSMIFGSSGTPPGITKIIGKYDWFFILDSNNDTWTFGETRFSCGCQPDSTTRLTAGTKVTQVSNVKWVFPILNYVTDFDNAAVYVNATDASARGTVFVSPTSIKYCGSSLIWRSNVANTALETLELPSSLNATNPIVAASFSALSGVIKLKNGEIWGIGYPENPYYMHWQRYDNAGALKNKNVGQIVALTAGGLGGVAVSSCAYLLSLRGRLLSLLPLSLC